VTTLKSTAALKGLLMFYIILPDMVYSSHDTYVCTKLSFN